MTIPPLRSPPEEHILPESEKIAELKRLQAIFNDMETKQLDFLDEAGKRLIELITLLLGVLLAIVAFGDNFPPPYLVGNWPTKALSAGTLACYILAMGLALRGVQPRGYAFRRYDPAQMRTELERIIRHKRQSLWWAGLCFWIASLTLALLIITIIMRA